MKLSELVENPDNPSVATDEEIKRLKGKLERVPKGLTAMRIAYVTDKIEGKKMVISGNKRLRVLKEQFGEDTELPDEYFQDVTSMSEAERHEFIVTANISDGHWDAKKLLEQYDTSELSELMEQTSLDALLSADASSGMPDRKQSGTLSKRYIVPPFSVLRAQSGEWLARKREWRELIEEVGDTRKHTLADEGSLVGTFNDGVSIFDPVLAEVICKWFGRPNCKVYDCFAGDTIFGHVSSKMGYQFTGIELREEQVANNIEHVKKHNLNATYICDDGQNVLKHIPENSQDLLTSCPPYFNLEVYSDKENDASNQKTYEDFLKIIDNAYSNAIKCLKDNRFAVIVVGDIRDERGFYYDFPGDIKRIFKKNGMHLYNEIILVDPIGTAMMRCNNLMSNRKTVKIHQNAIVFYKGQVPATIHKDVLVFYKGQKSSDIHTEFEKIEFQYEDIESTALDITSKV